MKRVPLKWGLFFATSLFAVTRAGAQCSLCRLAVEQDASLGTAFNKAIVLMMIPALAVFVAVFLLATRSKPDSRPKEETKVR
jgi:hypothetical protein